MQVPDAVVDRASPVYKGRVWIDRIQNSAVLDAFSQAAQQDLRNFLLARADELMSGGLLVFLVPGSADERSSNFQWCPESEYSGPSDIVYEQTWQELVDEVTSQSLSPAIAPLKFLTTSEAICTQERHIPCVGSFHFANYWVL